MLFLCNNAVMENKKEANLENKSRFQAQKNENLMGRKLQLSKSDKVLSENKSRTKQITKRKTENGKSAVEKKIVEEKENPMPEKMVELLINNNTERPIFDIILCNLIALTAIFLSIFIPVLSLALPFLVFLYFDVGVASYMICKERGGSCCYEQIFISIRKYIKIFCVAIIKIFSIAFGLALFIVPGCVMILNYCFTSHIIAENSDLDAKGVLMLSKELVYGYRWNIFFYALLALVAVCASISLMFFIILIFDVFLYVPSVVYIVFVLMAGMLAFVTLSLPMLQIAVTDYYILAKQKTTKAL